MNDYYFSSAPQAEHDERDIRVRLAGHDVTVRTDANVFSRGGLDTGTSVLLKKGGLPDSSTTGILVDVGCGWGPIALALALSAPQATVWAVDVNERARALTAHNAARLGLSVEVMTPEEALARPEKVTEIWSNPPIRIGKAALHDLLLAWMGKLADDGEAFWVVQKNLGAESLAAWLTSQGYPTDKSISGSGFKVLRSRAGM